MSSSLLPLNIGPQTTSSQPPPLGCVLITIEEGNGSGGRLEGAAPAHAPRALTIASRVRPRTPRDSVALRRTARIVPALLPVTRQPSFCRRGTYHESTT